MANVLDFLERMDLPNFHGIIIMANSSYIPWRIRNYILEDEFLSNFLFNINCEHFNSFKFYIVHIKSLKQEREILPSYLKWGNFRGSSLIFAK